VFAVVQFPGSNDDRDMCFALKTVLGADASLVWHADAKLPAGTRGILLPGGFSYGDYLRTGAMARFSPIMAAVKRFAEAGGPVLGTCNGFQVLCEAELLPGVLRRNRDLHYICREVDLRVERASAPFTSRAEPGDVLRIPIKHGEGAYFASDAELAEIESHGQVVLRYSSPEGLVDHSVSPNGSRHAIAGLVNRAGNVLGMMPHPEHAVEPAIGGTDGRVILGSLVDHVVSGGGLPPVGAGGPSA
jgi:phosphoribosylformylglycinamidine synthase I